MLFIVVRRIKQCAELHVMTVIVAFQGNETCQLKYRFCQINRKKMLAFSLIFLINVLKLTLPTNVHWNVCHINISFVMFQL